MNERHGVTMTGPGRALCLCGYLAAGRTRIAALKELIDHIDNKTDGESK